MTQKRAVQIGPLDTVGAVITEMGRLYRAARREKMPSATAARLCLILREIRRGLESRDRRISAVIRIDQMSEAEVLEFLGGEPDAEEFSAVIGAADPAPGRHMGLSDLRDGGESNGVGGL